MTINTKIEYFEIESTFKKQDKLSICTFENTDTEISSNKKLLYFIPEIGVSYRSYEIYFKRLLKNNIFQKIVTFDHYGSGVSSGPRGLNVNGRNYLIDFKNIYQSEIGTKHNFEKVFVFGHGFGATLSLLLESEGSFDFISGIIIEDPFFRSGNKMNILNKMAKIFKSKKINSYLKVPSFYGEKYFPKLEDQLNFDYTCYNSKYFNVDFIETYKILSANVIERAYLTEKNILHLYSIDEHEKNAGELINLYHKGVGEKKVHSYRLDKNGYFENFHHPSPKYLEKLSEWTSEF